MLAGISLAVLLYQSRRPHPPEKLFVNRVAAAEAAGEAAEENEENGNDQ